MRIRHYRLKVGIIRTPELEQESRASYVVHALLAEHILPWGKQRHEQEYPSGSSEHDA